VLIPLHRAAPSAPRSSILQMRLGQEGAINEDAVPGPASTAVA
jgi:hypothetical protein